jgi:glycosyltransferase involved in cell wall biosynthesis
MTKTGNMPKTMALIPAYNEERKVGEVVAGCKPLVDYVVVVDDGSTDRTAQKAKLGGAIVLSQPRNMGKGWALLRGFQYAQEQGMDYIITLDADGQHPPKHIPQFITQLDRGYGVVVGNRMADLSGMPFERRFSNLLTSFVISLISGQYIADSQNGYRGIATEVVRGLTFTRKGFEMEAELLFKAVRRGFRISSTPIDTVYTGEEQSKIDVPKDIARFVLYFVSEVFDR